MIHTPTPCIWMRPVAGENLEILILGDPYPELNLATRYDIAKVFIGVRKLAESWPGWDRVDVLAMGSTLVGLRCHLGKNAGGLDLMAEGMRMLQDAAKAMDWHADTINVGMIATW